MNNNKTWLLIADSSQARLYALHKARLYLKENASDNLELIGEFAHNSSRQKDSELNSDKMGEFGSGTFVEATSAKVHEAEVFALQLLTHLDTGRKLNHFKDLILVAPPAFMGLLKKHMPHEMQKLISKTIEKDYTHQTDRELVH